MSPTNYQPDQKIEGEDSTTEPSSQAIIMKS